MKARVRKRTVTKKVNPRKRPASEADVEKSWMAGIGAGIDQTMVLFLNVMRDKFGFGPVRLTKVMLEFNKKLEDIREQRITLADLQQVLEDEAGITVDGLRVSVRGVKVEEKNGTPADAGN